MKATMAWRCRACDDLVKDYLCVPFELNQPDDVHVIPKHVLVDKDEDLEEEEFKEEEEPQEEEDDMEIEETVEPVDETVPLVSHVVGESVYCPFLRERLTMYVSSVLCGRTLTLYLGRMPSISDGSNEVRSSVEEGTAAMGNLVRKLGNAEERANWDLCWKKDRMRLSMFQLKMKRVHHLSRGDSIVTLSTRGQVTAPVVRECTFAGFMKCNPDNFRGTEGAVELRRWFEKTEMTSGINECAKDKKVKFAVATLRGPALTWWNSKVAILGLDVANQIGMVEPKSVKADAYIRGLTDNIKGEVTSSKPTNLNEVVRMAHKLMEHKAQARNKRILEGNKQK
ncbi:hypothetical protein Tco_1124622 [Tanacetum coccineum]|uniref:Zinc finger, CCHC-type, retrotransposon Gag domain protein n=1 Tax=Tanacetum coccineum TaxID=301880 RepID=A0ABQ5J9G5_9ASTR